MQMQLGLLVQSCGLGIADHVGLTAAGTRTPDGDTGCFSVFEALFTLSQAGEDSTPTDSTDVSSRFRLTAEGQAPSAGLDAAG